MMTMCPIVLVLLLFSPALAAATDYAMEGDVFALTNDNFDAFLKEHPVSMVQFHTPWCSKCKEFAPDWAKLASKAKAAVPLATVDAIEHKEIADRYNVYGYPNIHLFHDGDL